MTIYVLCGLPASGKSTISEEMAIEKNAKLFHCDNYTAHKLKDFYSEIREALHTTDVVVDGIFLTRKARNDLLNELKNIDCEKILVKVETSVAECIKRNKDRKHPVGNMIIHLLHKHYQEPMLAEGWNEIQHV
jgi:tRNA uridine 5-carbamoylmethylation protein Kti12